MAGQIPEQEKTKRSHVLLELDERRRQEYMEGFLGKELEVLMEEEVEIDGVHYWTGHTREYLRVAVLSEENLMNQMVLVTPARIRKNNTGKYDPAGRKFRGVQRNQRFL